VTATVDAEAGVEGPGPVCDNLAAITTPIAAAVRAETETVSERHGRNEEFVTRVTILNVRRTMREILERSGTLRKLVDDGTIRLVGGIYDVSNGEVTFLNS